MKAIKFLKDYIDTSSKVLASLAHGSIIESMSYAVEEILQCYYKRGGKVFLYGNGGSALIAQHIAEELVGGGRIFHSKRFPLSAEALSMDAAKITAIANDFGFENIFVRQLDSALTSLDVVIAISTSGNSSNVLKATKFAKKRGAKTIGLTGKSGGKLAGICDIVIKVPSNKTSVIQEGHTVICHALSLAIEKGLFGKEVLYFS